MLGHLEIIEMRKRRQAPAWVWISETGDDWGKFDDAMPTVIIDKTERLEALDLRWCVGLNLSIAAVGDRAKSICEAFKKYSPKRMICTTFEKMEGYIPFGVTEITDTDEVITWRR